MVMYNADLFTRLLPSLTSLVGRLRPVLFTAVAYPMGSGLTLAMFALVIFTLVAALEKKLGEEDLDEDLKGKLEDVDVLERRWPPPSRT